MSAPLAQPPAAGDWAAKVKTGVGDIQGSGGRFALAAIAVFGAWAVLFPLSSAVVAPATLMAKGHNKVLQHRSGGAIREILVLEGDVVRAGDPIAVLSPEIDKAQLSRLKAQYSKALAQRARLSAEKLAAGDNDEVLGMTKLRGAMPGDIDRETITSAFGKDEGKPLIDLSLRNEQRREYEKGRAAANAEVTALAERAEAMRAQQSGVSRQQQRVEAQVSLLSTQRNALADLVAQDFISKQQLWDMETRLLERQSQLDQLRAQHDALTSSIGEIEAQMRQAEASDQRKTSEVMTTVLAEIAELGDQIKAAEVGLEDTVIRAPVAGTLVHSKLNTIGGVVPPGQTVGEIVPASTELLVQGRVGQHDIADVHVGQPARVTISALNSRVYDALDAKVVYVAADATTDDRTGERFFEVRAALDVLPDELKPVLTAGMGGQIQIQGPSRTFLGYLMRPIDDSFSRAFKEQR